MPSSCQKHSAKTTLTQLSNNLVFIKVIVAILILENVRNTQIQTSSPQYKGLGSWGPHQTLLISRTAVESLTHRTITVFSRIYLLCSTLNYEEVVSCIAKFCLSDFNPLESNLLMSIKIAILFGRGLMNEFKGRYILLFNLA